MADTADPVLGQLVAGRYRVIRPLGEGGMGHVYLAMHEAIEKQVALKVLKPEYSAKEDIVTRFQQEAISASRIKHPNVLEVFDFGSLDNGCAFLAMEFLSGNDLADELMHLGYIETRRALRITLQICRALASAHRAGVVHRDMKPDNVFLQRTGDGEEIVKIVDFGIAQLRHTNEEEAKSAPRRRRLTKTGMIFGTPEYMAPEQAAGKKADQRVDVYAVGIILFEMLTGAVPFTGDSFMAVLAAHLNDPVPSMLNYRPDLDVSQPLHAVVGRALSKSADERFGDMTEFAAALMETPECAQLHARGELNPTTLPPPAPGGGLSKATRPQGSGSDPSLSHRASSDPGPVRGSDPAYARSGGTVAVGSPAAASVTGVSERPGTLESAATTQTQGDEKKSSVVPIVAVFGALAVAAAVGWFVVVPKLGGGEVQTVATGETPTPTAEPMETAPAATTAAPTEEVASAPTATSEPDEPTVAPAESDKIKISVETTPSGAVLEKDGFQVCDKTPCQVELDAGEAVEFTALLNGRKGVAKVLAQKDQTVTIALPAPRPRPKPRPGPTQPKLCEVKVGGLKVWRECPK